MDNGNAHHAFEAYETLCSDQRAARAEKAAALHPFERRGLGRAPFRFVGMEQQDLCYGRAILNRAEYERTGIALTTAPGGSCAYCGQYIVDMYNVRSADGRTFHVGSECVHKTGDAKLVDAVKRAERKLNRAKAAARATAKRSMLADLLADDATRAALAAQPHPNTYRAQRGETMLDWAQWMAQHSGAAGTARTLKAVRSAVEVSL